MSWVRMGHAAPQTENQYVAASVAIVADRHKYINVW